MRETNIVGFLIMNKKTLIKHEDFQILFFSANLMTFCFFTESYIGKG